MSELPSGVNSIKGEEITFVVQGPVVADLNNGYTSKLCDSIKKFFPHSPLIFSTWSGQSVANLKVDRLIFSKDPGPLYLDENRIYVNNINRQITSTIAGLEAVETRFAVKLRSDLIFKGDILKQLINHYVECKPKPSGILTRYCIVSNFTSIRPSKYAPYLFHPCDWIFAGLTSDVRKIWYCQEVIKLKSNRNLRSPTLFGQCDPQDFVMRPESHIWITFLNRNGFSLESGGGVEQLYLSEQSIFQELIIFNNLNLGILAQKKKLHKGMFHFGNSYNAISSNSVRKRLGMKNLQKVTLIDLRDQFSCIFFPVYRLCIRVSQKLRKEVRKLQGSKSLLFGHR
jgi:hypothetical protein